MREITLTNYPQPALVDDADYEFLSQFKWHAKTYRGKQVSRVYVLQNRKKPGTNQHWLMHHLIIGQKGIDHADRNGLNNQRYNLRPADKSQNGINRPKLFGKSRFKGVTQRNGYKTWTATIKVRGVRIHLGQFKDEVDAAQVYNLAAYEYFGDFAYMNTPDSRLP